MSTPGDRKYARTHEWVKIEGSIATVGITDHAQEALGDITFVELPKINAPVKKQEACGVIESVKAASDLFSPLSGTVSEINDSLETAPEAVNSDPYGKGWLYKITGFAGAEAAALLDAVAYDALVESEG